MSMQIDTRLQTALTAPGSAGSQQVTRNVPVATPRVQNTPRPAATSFPEQPLISSQPLRYNVQLNKQLTQVQQAEHYLQGTEKLVLQLSSAITKRAGDTTIGQQAQQLNKWLDQRPERSGGTVDRQLQVNLEGKSRVSFTLRDGDALLKSRASEVLTFSLAGNKRDVSAASLDADSSPRQNLVRLNQALGKWGIHGALQQGPQGQNVAFEVDEQRWSRVSQHLSVQGNGQRYPEGQFYPVKPQASGALQDDIAALAKDPARAERVLPQLESALTTLSQQRGLIQRSKASVQARIQSMATFKEGNAMEASQQIGDQLQSRDFATLAKAVGGQANVHAATVRNVLST
ncbi:hypothetical protein CIG19_06180 [Enterobacterales bacterium CwR94]|nr:hypothetical protein CIG19_06180 [Enterobacterales bacterium CwR94]